MLIPPGHLLPGPNHNTLRSLAHGVGGPKGVPGSRFSLSHCFARQAPAPAPACGDIPPPAPVVGVERPPFFNTHHVVQPIFKNAPPTGPSTSPDLFSTHQTVHQPIVLGPGDSCGF